MARAKKPRTGGELPMAHKLAAGQVLDVAELVAAAIPDVPVYRPVRKKDGAQC